ncbi:MAG TPA: PH domain-containing protein [Ilumatobacteraceae bacterium]|nr:PH domain-containing protein [Ilumatobacteraceae bacterium]
MAYPRRLLDDHESVTVDLHPHWWFLAAPTVSIVASIAAALGTLALTTADTTVRTGAGWAALVALVLSSSWLVLRYAKWITTHFVVTDRRIIFRTGLLAKRGLEIPVDRVQAVHFHQGVWERIVGAGDLMIESGGESGQQHFSDIRQPDRVQRVLHAQLDERRRATASTPLDIAAQLERLESLLHRGSLTPEEFERQKRRLLER